MRDGELSILDVSETGAISYRAEIFYEDAVDSVEYGDFDHVGPTEEKSEEREGATGPIELVYLLASAPSLAAFASMVKAYLLRNKGRQVNIFWKDGTARLEVTGDLSADEIARLLSAQMDDRPAEDEGAGEV
ncbi:hypothetical protein [Nocardia africana]